MQLFSRQKPLVGLDIGSSSVKAVELRKAKDGYELLHAGLEPLASDTVVDGAIMDALSVSDSITKIFSQQKNQDPECCHFGFRPFGDRQKDRSAGYE